MSIEGRGSDGAGSKTLAAVMIAVQAYLDQEGGSSGPKASRGLSDWKMASWQTIRRRAGELRPSWKSQR